MNTEPTNTAAFDALLAKLKCPVCKELLREPFVTGCGHTFCHACINHHSQTTSQLCPCCGTYMIADQVKPVFVLDKVLVAAREMSEARSSSGAQLASFLRDTPVIQTCQEVDSLITILNERRSDIERNQVTAQLQLLYLFLDHVRQSKEVELSASKRRLSLIQQDLNTVDEQDTVRDGMQARENAHVGESRQHRIAEHFGELQEQYQQMCTSHAQHQHSHSAGTGSVGTEQAAAPDAQLRRNGNANPAVLRSELMHPQLNAETQTRESHGYGYRTGAAANSTPAADIAGQQRNVAAGDEPTMSEQRLHQLDAVLRTVTQEQSPETPIFVTELSSAI